MDRLLAMDEREVLGTQQNSDGSLHAEEGTHGHISIALGWKLSTYKTMLTIFLEHHFKFYYCVDPEVCNGMCVTPCK